METPEETHDSPAGIIAERLDHLERLLNESISKQAADLDAFKCCHDLQSVALDMHIPSETDLKSGPCFSVPVEEGVKDFERLIVNSVERHGKEFEAMRKSQLDK